MLLVAVGADRPMTENHNPTQSHSFSPPTILIAVLVAGRPKLNKLQRKTFLVKISEIQGVNGGEIKQNFSFSSHITYWYYNHWVFPLFLPAIHMNICGIY